MSLFQRAVQKEAIHKLNSSNVAQAYQRFQQQFGNIDFQNNVRLSKEESYQAGFLNDLFVQILGYTLNPQPNYNLVTEQKNVANAQKADGAILKNGQPIAVIELKSVRTPVDSKTIVAQAFGYKYNQPTAQYVITSNFQKLRFYIDDAVAFEEFDLFALTETDFSLLYLCLHKEQLLADVPKQLKIASIHKTEQITHQLYLDYSKFKDELYTNLKQWNRQHDALTLFKKSQKLLDRFLFFCFAKDKGLLPAKTLTKILEDWDALNALDESKPLYDIFKKYFRYLNDGFSSPHLTIFGYNGGLFAPDPLLDSLKIPDGLLYSYIPTLGKYDFDSDVDTNILGHIFEHSLNELDEKTAQAIGQTADKSKTKRKKDGIFYTPRSITQYMVEQTIGALCQQKQTELAIDRLDWWEDCPSATAMMRLHTYRGWLLQLTVLDPACGSGAFLNQAFVFLRAEHRMIDAMLATLTGKTVEKTDWATHILDHNLFGVDINEESVEIAKLSLWLRTAKVGRKLNDLSANIQIGNSLIDDPEIAGDLAFDWQKAFPQVFEKGGFDVVIGNPPYVRQELLGDFKPYLSKNYQVYASSSDLFAYFYERSIQVLKQNGYLGFISNTFDKTTASQQLRTFLQEQTTWRVYADYTAVQVFEGATTYPIIFIAQNQSNKNNNFSYIKIVPEAVNDINNSLHSIQTIAQANLHAESWSFQSGKGNNLIQKVLKHETVKQQFGKCYRGILTGLNEAFILTGAEKSQILKADPQSAALIKPFYEGKDLKKWHTPKPEQHLILFPSKWTKQQFGATITEQDALNYLNNNHNLLINKLLPFETLAKKRCDKGDFWWELRNCAYYNLFESSKIIFPNLQHMNKFAIDEKGSMINAPAVFLPTDDKALLAILNSKVIWYFLKTICVVRSGGYIEVKPQYFEQIPIPALTSSNKASLSKLAEQVIHLTIQLQSAQTDFLHLLTDNFTHLKVNRAIESWHEGDFAAFKKTLEKQKRTIPLKAQKEWREMFASSKTAYQNVQTQIATTDKAIDAAVYALYELTAAEIQLIENQ
jgi:type I restriction-modification system DNA methylase subunit